MAARVLDAPSRDRLARRSVCTTAASSDTRVGTAPPLLSVAARRASLFQRSSAARAPSRSSSNVPPFAHPFGCSILEGFSIRFRRGLFYLVTTCPLFLLTLPFLSFRFPSRFPSQLAVAEDRSYQSSTNVDSN